MSVTFSSVDGRRQIRSQRPPPRRRSFSRAWSPWPRHDIRREKSPRPRRYSSQESSSSWFYRRRNGHESVSRSPPARAKRFRSSPPRLQIVIPNDAAIRDQDDRRWSSPESDPGINRPTILLMSKKFQNDPNTDSARPQLVSRKFRLEADDDDDRSAAALLSDARRLARNEQPSPIRTPSKSGAMMAPDPDPSQRDAEPRSEPKPIVSSRSRFRALEAYPELFGNGSHPGVLLVQNLPLDVTGQEIVMKVFPEHDIVAADLYESDDHQPYAEVLFPRVQDAVGALQRHMGQIYRGHSLKIALLSSYKV